MSGIGRSWGPGADTRGWRGALPGRSQRTWRADTPTTRTPAGAARSSACASALFPADFFAAGGWGNRLLPAGILLRRRRWACAFVAPRARSSPVPLLTRLQLHPPADTCLAETNYLGATVQACASCDAPAACAGCAAFDDLSGCDCCHCFACTSAAAVGPSSCGHGSAASQGAAEAAGVVCGENPEGVAVMTPPSCPCSSMRRGLFFAVLVRPGRRACGAATGFSRRRLVGHLAARMLLFAGVALSTLGVFGRLGHGVPRVGGRTVRQLCQSRRAGVPTTVGRRGGST
ncbi:MAG: hypothetical protein JWP65_470 [Ramlibacter sp.]|nr:hypothetical protein [Ramlibacter sp.]